jgi:AcrR family transcriptional regulator
MKTKHDVVCEFRRMEIGDAARTVFARKGFELATMDEIAEEAGVAKGTIYLYFRSKTEVYQAVLAYDMKDLIKGTLERIDAAATLREKIAAFNLARLEYAEAKRDFFQIMDTESANLTPTRSQYRKWMREPVLRLASAIEEAAQRGEIRQISAEKTAWLIADMARGTIQRRLLEHRTNSPSEDAEFLSDFVWASLTAQSK